MSTIARIESILAESTAHMTSAPANDNADKSMGELIRELGESTRAHAAALNELQSVMIARGLITHESLARARAEMEAGNA